MAAGTDGRTAADGPGAANAALPDGTAAAAADDDGASRSSWGPTADGAATAGNGAAAADGPTTTNGPTADDGAADVATAAGHDGPAHDGATDDGAAGDGVRVQAASGQVSPPVQGLRGTRALGTRRPMQAGRRGGQDGQRVCGLPAGGRGTAAASARAASTSLGTAR